LQSPKRVARRQQQAIEIDPDFAWGYKGLAWVRRCACDRTPTEADGVAEALARRVVALDPTDAEARSTLKCGKKETGDSLTVHGFRNTFRDWCAENG
jgi:hypothetical protein